MNNKREQSRWIKIFRAPNEVEASLLKGYLESKGIKANVIPDTTSAFMGRYAGTRPATLPHYLFVEEGKAEEAKELLESL